MPALVLYVSSIAIADSINPSTVIPALGLSSHSRRRLDRATVELMNFSAVPSNARSGRDW
jgi:hypothetical protein